MSLPTQQLAREIFVACVSSEMCNPRYDSWQDLAAICYDAALAFFDDESDESNEEDD